MWCNKKRNRENYPEKASPQRNKETRIKKFNLELALTSLQTTGPSQGTEYKVFLHVA